MPITIVLGAPEYCGILIILVLVIVLKFKRQATGGCTNPCCQSRPVNHEKEFRKSYEMPVTNKLGNVSEPPVSTSNPWAAFPPMATKLDYHQSKSGNSNMAIPATGYNQNGNAFTKMTGNWAVDTWSPKPEYISTLMGNDVRTLRPGYENQSNCGFFIKLPLEIRNKIYEDMLMSNETITPKQQLLGKTRKKQTYERGYYKPAAGLDARILASCRAICYEAYPILYGRNTFSFDGAYDVMCFGSDELKDDYGPSERTMHLGLDYVSRKEGRFALINKIKLDMSKDPGFFVLAYDSLSGKWGTFLEQDLWFSAVECLYLDCSRRDFSDPGERLFMHDFIDKIKGFGRKKVGGSAVGLRKLTFKGVCDESLKGELRGLLAPDGEFVLEVPGVAE